MKSFIKINLFLIPLILLTACNGTVRQTEGEAEDLATETTTKITCRMLENSDREEECNEQSNDVAAQALEDEILDTFDSARCGKLPENMAEDCKDSIEQSGVQGPVSAEELEIFDAAMEYITPEEGRGGGYSIVKCSLLTTPGFQTYCEAMVNELIDEDVLDEIVDSGDSTRCNELKTEEINNRCLIEFNLFSEDDSDLGEIAEPVEGGDFE